MFKKLVPLIALTLTLSVTSALHAGMITGVILSDSSTGVGLIPQFPNGGIGVTAMLDGDEFVLGRTQPGIVQVLFDLTGPNAARGQLYSIDPAHNTYSINATINGRGDPNQPVPEGSLRFTGRLDGDISLNGTQVTNDLTNTGPAPQSIQLGKYIYTMSFAFDPQHFDQPFRDLGNKQNPDWLAVGHMDVSLNVQPIATPEPATLTLAGLGLAGAAGVWLKRRYPRPSLSW